MSNTDATSRMTLAVRRIIYAFFAVMDSVIGRFGTRKARAIVLCYHSIASDSWRFNVSQEKFKKQIEWLIQSGFEFLTLRDIDKIIGDGLILRKPSVAITFDDGYKDIFTVKDWLYEKGIFPTVFVLSDSDRAILSETAPGKEFLSADDIRSLRTSGWEVGCHSATHPDFSQISEDAIPYEVVDAKARLESVTGGPVSYFAYPRGYYSLTLIENVRQAGYKMAFTMDDNHLDPKSDPLMLPRIGVDSSHTLEDFRGMITWLAITFRMVVKRILAPRTVNRLLGIK